MLQIGLPKLPVRLQALGRFGNMALRSERLQSLAAEPGKRRLPNLRRCSPVAHRAQLYDGGHRHLLIMQPDLHASDVTGALANREDGRETGVQLIGVLVEAVFQRLALGDEVVDRAQGDEGESRRRAVGEPGRLYAGTKALNEAQALTPRRQLLARALEAHVRRPGLAQKPVPEQARSAAEPGPGRQQSELLLRRALKVAL